MPRRSRSYLPGLPYHIVQRGNNKQACFIDPENYHYYLSLLETISIRYKVSVHSYCLMTNHIHLLATPTTKESISNTMKVVGSRYAQYINKKYKRTGTLWEGRHKSSLVQTDKYFLTCSRYIELNPVAAAMVQRPEEYECSSYKANSLGKTSWLQQHDVYKSLGKTEKHRCKIYRELFNNDISVSDRDLIESSIHYCQPLADDTYKSKIESEYGIRFGHSKRGRPKSNPDTTIG